MCFREVDPPGSERRPDPAQPPPQIAAEADHPLHRRLRQPENPGDFDVSELAVTCFVPARPGVLLAPDDEQIGHRLDLEVLLPCDPGMPGGEQLGGVSCFHASTRTTRFEHSFECNGTCRQRGGELRPGDEAPRIRRSPAVATR